MTLLTYLCKQETLCFAFIKVEVVHLISFSHLSPSKKKKKDICVKAQPEVGRGHSQIIIMLMQGTPRVVSIVKVMVFVGTEIKGTK